MRFTPRQIAGFLELGAARRKHDAAVQLAINALAAQGESKTINKRLRELSR